MKTTSILFLLLVVTCIFTKGEGQATGVDDIVEEGIAGDEDDDDDIDENQELDVVPSAPRENPCNTKQCQRGEECIVENGKAKCVCKASCPQLSNPRQKVCASKNTTFDSECHLDREVCLCKTKSPECSNPAYKKLRLNYYGGCQSLPKCDDIGMKQFPERMEGWLAVIMNTMAERHQLGEYEALLVNDDLRKRINAVIWKFCDLDSQPQDRRVSRKELQLIIASIRPMEPCLVPFLNRCDANGDRKITLKEWGTCLGLKRDEIVDRCKNLREKTRRD